MNPWSHDYGTVDRALFIRSHRRILLSNVARTICTERNFWRLVAAVILFYGAYILPVLLRALS